jgi:hypothetical protein
MGKYDMPHFESNNNIVSVWLANTEYNEIPENYWVENYEGDDDDSWNQFSNDFGFGRYDIDLVENFFDDKNYSKIPIFNLLKYLSYSKSFIDEVIEKADKLLLQKESSYAYLIYNFEYDPLVTGISESSFFTFIGAFEYDVNSDSVENFFNE